VIKIRRARRSDKRAVRDICARIWTDDYVPSVFDAWLPDRRGGLWVAVVDARVVAVAKLTLLGDREAWLHGLRVDPRYQRRGIATALLDHRVDRARRLGARVARLDTSEDNVAVRRLMRRFRFRRIARVHYFHATPSAVDAPRSARARELDALWRLARGRLLHGDYTTRLLIRADVARAIRAHSCFAVGSIGRPRAVAIAEAQTPAQGRPHFGSRLRIRIVAGTPAATRELLVALRGQARAARVERAGIAPPDDLSRAVRAAGYRRRWQDAMFVFERRL